MADILELIVATKREEVNRAKVLHSIHEMGKRIETSDFPQYSLASALLAKPGIIAEFKRASPSKGVINATHTPNEIITGYDKSGALGISVLTDQSYFKAEEADFEIARKTTLKPLLRKEFIIDAYQIYQSKMMGANVILLIAAILSKKQILEFTTVAHSLKLEVLIELHSAEEIEKLSGKEDLIGVNNRNLKTFEVNIEQSIQIKKLLGKTDFPLISESGLSDIKQVEALLTEGFRGFLMGEYFMKQENPMVAFANFNQALNRVTGQL